jgi:hypothetical protein
MNTINRVTAADQEAVISQIETAAGDSRRRLGARVAR